MTGRKGRPLSHGAGGLLGLAGVLAAAAVMALMPAPASASGLLENIFGGLSRTFTSEPPPPPPPPEPVSDVPDGYYPSNQASPQWRGAGRSNGAIALGNRAAKRAPMGDPTLRPGDVVATVNGLRVYTGGRRGLPDFVSVKAYPYFGAAERNRLLALRVTPPDRRWGAEAPPAPAATVSALKPDNPDRLDEFASISTAQR